jgi:poly(hydroxyalkanoate) depolymerase family esterase
MTIPISDEEKKMKTVFNAAMQRATELTREQNVVEATRLIQLALKEKDPEASPGGQSPESPRLVELRVSAEHSRRLSAPVENARIIRARPGDATSERAEQRPKILSKLLRRVETPTGFDPAILRDHRTPPSAPVPDGAAYLARTFACEAGSREYKVFVPSHADGRSLPLVVMLHGCTQNSDDFAVGTGMNLIGEAQRVIVAYPQQALSANHSACWNWFDVEHQMRNLGEPSLIAGITRAIMAEFDVDADCVYVAGLSAGGAMAAVMGAAYPDLYAAVGIHSGLAYGSAIDMTSAFAAMRGPSSPIAATRKEARSRYRRAEKCVRTIVFHGASDRKVHPINAEAIVADARAGLAGTVNETRHDGSARGRSYTRTVIADERGVPHVEHWLVGGLGHAWSGGHPDGSHTDQQGPDASREMLRFFLAPQRTHSGRKA